MPRDVSRKLMREKLLDKAKKVDSSPVVKRKPRKSARVTPKKLVSRYSIRNAIMMGATNRSVLIIRYKKVTTGKIKNYTVEPYSYRFRKRPGAGYRKALYAHDVKDGHIKAFYIRNIMSIQTTSKTYKPRWRMEIGF